MKNIYIMLILLLIGCSGSNDEINNEDTSNYGFEFPDWIIGWWQNSYESNLNNIYSFRFEKHNIYYKTQLGIEETDVLQKISYDRSIFIQDSNYIGLFFIKDSDTISYEFKNVVIADQNVLLWNIKDSNRNCCDFETGMPFQLVKIE